MIATQKQLVKRTGAFPQYSYKLKSGTGYGLDLFCEGKMEVDESRMSAWVPFADGNNRDGVGDLLDVTGIVTSRHRKNPIALFDHGKNVQIPIGMCQDPQTEEYTVEIDQVANRARANVFFYQGKDSMPLTGNHGADHSLFCEQIFDLCVKGYLRSGSIGYQVIAGTRLPPEPQKGIPEGTHLHKVLMLEASIVVLPANADTAGKMLCLDGVCGKPLVPELRAAIKPHAPPKRATLLLPDRKSFKAKFNEIREKYAKEWKQDHSKPHYSSRRHINEHGQIAYVDPADAKERNRQEPKSPKPSKPQHQKREGWAASHFDPIKQPVIPHVPALAMLAHMVHMDQPPSPEKVAQVLNRLPIKELAKAETILSDISTYDGANIPDVDKLDEMPVYGMSMGKDSVIEDLLHHYGLATDQKEAYEDYREEKEPGYKESIIDARESLNRDRELRQNPITDQELRKKRDQIYAVIDEHLVGPENQHDKWEARKKIGKILLSGTSPNDLRKIARHFGVNAPDTVDHAAIVGEIVRQISEKKQSVFRKPRVVPPPSKSRLRRGLERLGRWIASKLDGPELDYYPHRVSEFGPVVDKRNLIDIIRRGGGRFKDSDIVDERGFLPIHGVKITVSDPKEAQYIKELLKRSGVYRVRESDGSIEVKPVMPEQKSFGPDYFIKSLYAHIHVKEWEEQEPGPRGGKKWAWRDPKTGKLGKPRYSKEKPKSTPRGAAKPKAAAKKSSQTPKFTKKVSKVEDKPAPKKAISVPKDPKGLTQKLRDMQDRSMTKEIVKAYYNALSDLDPEEVLEVARGVGMTEEDGRPIENVGDPSAIIMYVFKPKPGPDKKSTHKDIESTKPRARTLRQPTGKTAEALKKEGYALQKEIERLENQILDEGWGASNFRKREHAELREELKLVRQAYRKAKKEKRLTRTLIRELHRQCKRLSRSLGYHKKILRSY